VKLSDLTRDAVLSHHSSILLLQVISATNIRVVTGSAKIYLNGNQNEVRLENFSVSISPG
jgi:hypothetical protein